MSRPAADSTGRSRIAIVGAATPAGSALRKALADRAVPGSSVGLYGTTGGEVVLSEYDGEARIIQEPEPEEIASQDIVFLCQPVPGLRPALAAPGSRAIVIDLSGGDGGPSASLVHMALAPPPSDVREREFVIPDPIALVLAELIHPLERAFGIESVTAFVLRPAADFGQPGMDELRDQTVRLLSFASVPKEVFGRQLAFNLIPQQLLPEPDLERRVAGQVASLVGWREPRIAISIVTAPVFYGHAISLRVATERTAAVKDVLRAIGEDPRLAEPSHTTAATPLEVVEEQTIAVSLVSDDGAGGFWIWAVAGEAGTAAVEQAVLLAASLGDV